MKKSKILSIIFVITLLLGTLIFPNKTVFAETNTKKLKVNNTTLEFNQIIYVDGTTGDDSNGTGSKQKPFKTVVKGFDYLNENCRQGGAIVINDGTYDVAAIFQGALNNMNARYNGMNVSLLASTMGNVQFTNVKEWWVRENADKSYKIKVSLYGIIFKSAGNTYYHLEGDNWENEFYNCTFCAGYGGVCGMDVKVENSLFIGAPGECYTKDSPLKGTATNCASTTQYIDPTYGTKTNCLYNVTLDKNYNITSTGWKNAGTGTNPDGSVANIGVYGGQFSWGSKVSETTAVPKLKAVADNRKKQINLSWSAVSGSAISYNIYRSETPGVGYEKIGTSSSTSYIDADTNLLYEKTYYYVITAVDTGAESSYSNEESAIIKKPVNKLKLVLEKNEEKQLSVTDDLLDNTDMIWTSSDPTIATVNANGKLKALNPGNTVITCTNKDGSYTEIINVLVVNLDYQLAVDLIIGDRCRLTIDDLADTAKVTWKADDPTIATVSSKGKVTAVSEGLTYVTAIDSDGNEVGRIYIRVREK